MKSSLNSRYDIDGLEISRLARVALWSKFVPMGNFHGGPGGRCLAVLILLHYLGYPMYLLLARYGHRLHLLRRIAAKFRT
ncbi:MAG: hypothetical protein KJ630_18530 [Proteobacteria bacterium]|nr:hypothetical protein [Pseudomonadota bacterium]